MKKMIDYSNMIQVSEISDIQKLLYKLLKAFHKICQENDLYYCVFGGTLLGAVRHQAIIPWDDDIDVCMPRKDYERFCKIITEKYSDNYTIKCYPQNGYAYDYAKFCMNNTFLKENLLIEKVSKLMLYIDVFPVDGYPPLDDEKKHFDKLRSYKRARCRSIYKITVSKIWWKKPFAFFRLFKYLPCRLIGYKHFIKKEIDEVKKYSFDDCIYVSMQGAGWNEKGKLEKDIFLSRKQYRFGDLEVFGITDYDGHLTRLYGDYMTPPPAEMQFSNHSYSLYVDRRIWESLKNEK